MRATEQHILILERVLLFQSSMQIRCIPTYLLFNNSTKVLNRRSSNAFFWLALLRNEPIGVAPTRVCTTRTTVSFCSLLRLFNASIMGVFACDHRCVTVSPAAPPDHCAKWSTDHTTHNSSCSRCE